MCVNKPERWQSRTSKKYADRLAVRCKRCRRWIGYLPIAHKKKLDAGKLKKTARERADAESAETAQDLERKLFDAK